MLPKECSSLLQVILMCRKLCVKSKEVCKVGGQEGEDKVRINSEGPPPSLGTLFSQILSSLCLLL